MNFKNKNMPPAAKTLFEKRVLDSQKLPISIRLCLLRTFWNLPKRLANQKFLEVSEPFFKKVLTRRRQVYILIILLFLLVVVGAAGDSFLPDTAKKIAVNDKLSFIFCRDQSSAVTVLKIFFKGGKRAEPAEKRGLVYITAGLCVASPDAAIAGKLMHSGAVSYAEVEEDYVLITIKCLSDNLEETLKILSGIMKKPLFSGLRINNMKRGLKNRQKGETEDPLQLMNLTALNAFFAGNTYGGSVYGGAASLKAIKRKDVTGFYKKYFNAAGMVVSISSDLEESRVKDITGKYFSGFPAGGTAPLTKVEASLPKKKEFFFEKEKEQTLICLTALLPGFSPGDFVRAYVLENLLGKGIGSRLWRLRMEQKLAYDLDAVFTQLQDGGLLKIYLSTGNEKKETAYRALKTLLGELHEQGLGEDEFEVAKVHAKSDFLRLNEEKERRALYHGYFELMGIGFGFVGDFFTALDRLTLMEMNAYIKRVLNPGGLAEIIIGPKLGKVK